MPLTSAGRDGRAARPSLLVALIPLLLACERKAPPGDAGAPATASISVTPTASAPAPAQASVADASVPQVADVVSSASAKEGEGPSVVAAGEVDGQALRAQHRARLAADRSPVTILQGGSPLALGGRICEASVPRRAPETPVLIKPNIGGFEWFRDPAKFHGDDGVRGRITDPEFVRGIIRCLKARGHTRITVAEGWASPHANWETLVRVSGYAAMTREEGVPLVAMDDDGVFDVEGDTPGKPLRVTGMEKTHTPTLLMPKILAEHLQRGLFISAPKIKAHRFGVVSLSIKGGQGVVMLSDKSPAYDQKKRMHKELGAALDLLKRDPEAGKKAYLDALMVFSERMADVFEVATPDVVLAEGAPAMGGDGFKSRWPSPESVALGGTNPVLVDRVGAAYLGLWNNEALARELGGHATSPLIEVAAARLGIDLREPEVVGDGAALLRSPRPVHFVSMSGFALHSDDTPAELAPAAASAAGGPEADAGARPTLVAKAAPPGGIVVDGDVDPAWKDAQPASFETDWAGAPTGIRTRVRAAWAKDAFYMLWELEGAGLSVDRSRPTDVEREKLYEEDCVEVFVGRDPNDPRRYAEVEVGPWGHFFDLAIDRGAKKSDAAWSSKPTIATRVLPGGRVVIEMALRSSDVTAAFHPGARLPLALYRMEGRSPRHYLAWSPTRTPKPNFHVPEAFGTLVLE